MGTFRGFQETSSLLWNQSSTLFSCRACPSGPQGFQQDMALFEETSKGAPVPMMKERQHHRRTTETFEQTSRPRNAKQPGTVRHLLGRICARKRKLHLIKPLALTAKCRNYKGQRRTLNDTAEVDSSQFSLVKHTDKQPGLVNKQIERKIWQRRSLYRLKRLKDLPQPMQFFPHFDLEFNQTTKLR